MPLTMEWWKEQKKKTENKVNGKEAPETEFEKKLKLYETAMNTLGKEPTIVHCDAAHKALSDLETARKTSITSLENNHPPFKKLAGALNLETTIRKAGEEIDKTKEQLLSKQRIEKAHNHEEAVYDELWAAYEKQRAEVQSAPSRKLYALILASLNALEKQAVKAGASDAHLTPKYNKLASGLAAFKTQMTQAHTAYETAIHNAAQARIQALPPFTHLTPTLTQAKQNLTALKTQGQGAVTSRNSFILNTVHRSAQIAADAAVQQYDQVSATYAPGTMLRDSTDVKTAKIHADDSNSDIAPHSIALMQASNANTALKRDIERLAGEIAALKVT